MLLPPSANLLSSLLFAPLIIRFTLFDCSLYRSPSLLLFHILFLLRISFRICWFIQGGLFGFLLGFFGTKSSTSSNRSCFTVSQASMAERSLIFSLQFLFLAPVLRLSQSALFQFEIFSTDLLLLCLNFIVTAIIVWSLLPRLPWSVTSKIESVALVRSRSRIFPLTWVGNVTSCSRLAVWQASRNVLAARPVAVSSSQLIEGKLKSPISRARPLISPTSSASFSVCASGEFGDLYTRKTCSSSLPSLTLKVQY